jgi:phospholipase/lecithinase/hemolysin
MVVFGDSLSDNGNLYAYLKHQLPVSPPYFSGRFTNGRVWVELLMKAYYPLDSNHHLFDYAFGGAGVMEDDDVGDDLFTLRREMDSYFLANEDKADEHSMYVIWIGANNYLAVPDDLEQSLKDVNTGIQHGLQRLVDKGAKHIMVANLPNLGITPAAKEFDAVEKLAYLSKQHNKMLENSILELQSRHPEVQWIYLDVNVTFEDLINYPAKYGFSNVTDTCYEEASSLDKSPPSILKIVASIKPKMNLGPAACDGYLFFDPVHPSGRAHVLMAESAKLLFDEKGVVFN